MEKEKLQMLISPIGSGLKSVIVSKDMRIEDVRKEIEQQTELITVGQALCYQGEILDDEKALSEYGIIDNSVINLFARLRGGVKIFGKTMDGKTIGFKVQKADTIRDVKKKIHGKIGLAPDEQKLVYQGEILDNERTVKDYGIVEKSVIDVVARLRGSMLIFAKTMDGKTVAIEVQKADTIRDVKEKIQEEIGLARDEQKLVYQGGMLEDERTVGHYGIADGSVIHVVARLRGAMQMFAKTVNNKTVAIEVQKADTIRDVKKKIQKKFWLAPDEPKLDYEGQDLEDEISFEETSVDEISFDETSVDEISVDEISVDEISVDEISVDEISVDEISVEDYGIADGSVINVVEIGSMAIFAKTMDGKTVAIEVQKADTIRDVKKKIQKKIGLAPNEQKLVYQGGILEDERTVGHYGIADKSVINVVVRLRGRMQIFAKTEDGKTVAIEVQKADTIRDVKKKIQKKIWLAPDEQKLVYQGGILEDERVVGHYGIADKSVINVIIRLRGSMQIFAKTMEGKTVAFNVQKTEKISDIKKKIQEKIGLAPDEQKLVYQGGILEDERTAEEYQIAEISVINIVARPRRAMLIFAKTIDGKTVAIEVQKADTIRDVKKKIQRKIGLAPDEQKLVYQGQDLEDEISVEDYGIADKSVINVDILRKLMEVYVKKYDGKSVTIPVHNTDQIGNLKVKIEEKFGLAPESQTLVYQGDVLKDDKTYQEYQIYHQDVIIVVTHVTGGLQILTIPMEGGNVAVDFQIFHIISTNVQCHQPQMNKIVKDLRQSVFKRPGTVMDTNIIECN